MKQFLSQISALNDETRILILKFLDQYGSLCVCDLENSLNMIQSRLSRHLKILKDANFVDVERKGRWAYYSITKQPNRFCLKAMREIKDLNLELPILQKQKNKCCEEKICK